MYTLSSALSHAKQTLPVYPHRGGWQGMHVSDVRWAVKALSLTAFDTRHEPPARLKVINQRHL